MGEELTLAEVLRHGVGTIVVGVLFLITGGFFSSRPRVLDLTDELTLWLGIGLIVIGAGQAAQYYGKDVGDGGTDSPPEVPATMTPAALYESGHWAWCEGDFGPPAGLGRDVAAT